MKTGYASFAAALLLGSTLLSAAPDQERKSDRFDRSERSGHVERSVPSEQRDSVRRVERLDRSSRDTLSERRSYEEPGTRRTGERDQTVIRRAPSIRDSSPLRRDVRTEGHRIYRTIPRFNPMPHYRRPGYVIRTLPSAVISLTLGNFLFYYSEGIYYRRHQTGFIVALPPIGLIVPVLPADYVIVRLHGITYYYYGDVYYVWDDYHRAYRVVEAPNEQEVDYRPGDVLDVLPDGAYSVTIDGVQYYRFHGVYFLQTIQRDRIVYVVVTP